MKTYATRSGRRLLALLLMGFSVLSAYSNVAMPGFFGVGGSSGYQLFYPEDSAALSYVSMQQEWITVQLHKGFAAVRGEYEMYNSSDSTLRVRVGYPVNSLYEGGNSDGYSEHYEVYLDSLYALKVWLNDEEVQTQWLASKLEDTEYYERAADWSQVLRDAENWHIWEMTFPPKTVTRITVCFMINTGRARVRQGYDKDKVNGFSYLLESGRAWAGTIGKGRILVEMADDLKLEDLDGILPEGRFLASETPPRLLYDFENLEPGPMDNVLIRYGKSRDDWDFVSEAREAITYYDCLDNLAAEKLAAERFAPISRPDLFETKAKVGGFLVSLDFFLGIFGIPILLLLGIGFLIWFLWRRRKK